MSYRRQSSPGRKGLNAQLSRSFNAFVTSRGNTVANFNCLSCHSDVIDGKVIVGLGNSTRDFTQDLRLISESAKAFYSTPEEREEGSHFAQAMDAIGPYVKMKTIGSNPAVNLTYALFAARDSITLKWLQTPFMEPPTRNPPPVRVPP